MVAHLHHICIMSAEIRSLSLVLSQAQLHLFASSSGDLRGSPDTMHRGSNLSPQYTSAPLGYAACTALYRAPVSSVTMHSSVDASTPTLQGSTYLGAVSRPRYSLNHLRALSRSMTASIRSGDVITIHSQKYRAIISYRALALWAQDERI